MQDRNASRSKPASTSPAPTQATPGGGRRVQLRTLPYDQQVQLLDPEQGNASGAEPDQSLEAEPHHPTGPLDETSVERWIQSALNLLLGSSLAVDGAMKGPTAMAVRAFQKKAPELAKTRLTVDGVAGPMTIGALEKSVDAQAPDKTEAQLKAGSGKKEGEADAPAQNDAHPASTAKEDEGSESQVEQELKAEIASTAAKKKKGSDPVIDDVADAYRQARQWTMGQHDTPTTPRATETRARLGKKWDELRAEYDAWVERGKPVPASKWKKTLKDPGTKPDYIRAEWFKGYWSLWCYQFADKVASYMDGGRRTTLPALVKLTNAAVKEGGDGSAVKGRTTLHRSKTIEQMAQDEKGNPQLEPGSLLHVKLHYEGNTPYEFKDDFHHWIVWAGNGKFSDTLTGENTTGKANDASLKAWVKKSFAMPDYKFMHDDPRFSTARNAKGQPIPKEGLQPLLSAEFDTRTKPTQKEG